MKSYWTSFAKHGRPIVAGQPWWPAFTSASQAMLSLNTPSPQTETDFSAEHQCSFWNAAG